MPRRGSTKIRGLSKSISLHGFRGHVRYTKVLRAAKQDDRLRKINERRIASLQGIYIPSHRCPSNWVNHYLALPVEDRDAADQMFEDQGMNIQYDEPLPFQSQESDHDSEDDEDEFFALSRHVSEWSGFFIPLV